MTPELAFSLDTTTDEAERIAVALENRPPTIDVEKDEFGYPIVDGDRDDEDADGADDVDALEEDAEA